MPAQHVDAAAHYAPLGSIQSSAPVAALLATLQALRPQWHVRFVPVPTAGVPRYRVEVDDTLQPTDVNIDAWLHIKSALMAAYPADKPDAVTAIDP